MCTKGGIGTKHGECPHPKQVFLEDADKAFGASVVFRGPAKGEWGAAELFLSGLAFMGRVSVNTMRREQKSRPGRKLLYRPLTPGDDHLAKTD